MQGDSLILRSGIYEIIICDEAAYIPNSTDNAFIFHRELPIGESDHISSQHSIAVKSPGGKSDCCILLAGGGATGVHESSAFVHNNRLVIAVGSFACSLSLPELELKWCAKTDWVTCFGVYHSPTFNCYLSHGECEIARVSYSGEIVWQTSGKDIFTGAFTLHDDWIEVVDFNNERYQVDIETGVCILIKD